MWVGRTLDISPEMLAKIKALNEDAHGEPIAHASVVERLLETAGTKLRTGYVEAVATRPDRQGEGLATQILNAVTVHIRLLYELGALSTGENDFYSRVGWETWRGKTYVRTDDGLKRTEEEDGAIMILRTASTLDLDLDEAISCEWRPGDVW